MVNNFEEIARVRDIVLRRKAENYITVSLKGTDQIFPYKKRFWLYNRMICSVANIRS